MTNRQRSPLSDRELVEMLANEPELLAIADALVATRPSRAPEGAPSPRRRVRLGSFVAAATVAVGVVSVLLVAPWQGGGGLVERALAAVGQGPVLHVVTEQPSPYGWYQPVDLATGKPVPVTLQQEIWFDQGRDLKKTVSTLNGTVVDELLETSEGGFTPSGPVYTCAWIAAHPVEATKAHVSCNANMQNGTTPRQLPVQPPTLDLALAGFLDHYRSALASGQATQTGSGTLDGRQIIWLRISATSAGTNGTWPSEDVAIDSSTYTPLLVRASSDHSVSFGVSEIDTQAYDPSLFAPPALVQAPSIGEVASSTAIDPTQTPALLGGQALWLGPEWNGYRLIGTKRQELTTGYGANYDQHLTQSLGVVFVYAPISGTATNATLEIKEAAQCEMAWAMTCGHADPPSGALLSGEQGFPSVLRRDSLYIAISQVSQQADPVAVANALQPVPGG